MNIITPFSGVTLEIGGAVETYWKSLATPVPSLISKLTPQRPSQPNKPIGSTHTSPSNPSITAPGGHSLTHSSVTGSYVYVTVQVTRDLHVIAFNEWLLPEHGYDLGVADVTLAQFQALALRLGRSFPSMNSISLTPAEWHKLISRSMVPLVELLKVGLHFLSFLRFVLLAHLSQPEDCPFFNWYLPRVSISPFEYQTAPFNPASGRPE